MRLGFSRGVCPRFLEKGHHTRQARLPWVTIFAFFFGNGAPTKERKAQPKIILAIRVEQVGILHGKYMRSKSCSPYLISKM